MEKAKRKLLEKAIKDMKLPEGTVCGFGDKVDISYSKFDTPFPTLSVLTGGGFPRGRFTCISGPPGTAKTTLLLHQLAHLQQQDENLSTLWIDAENAFDPVWAQRLGVDTDSMIFVQKLPTLEAYMNALVGLIDTGGIDIAVVDSIGASAPRGEIESKGGKSRDLHDDTMALQARKYAQFCRVATPKIARNNTSVILIAQVYQDINSYGGLWMVKGGNALKHATYLRLMTRRSRDKTSTKVVMPDGVIKEIDLGWTLHIRIDKTKQNAREGHEIALPFRCGAGLVAAEAAVITAMQMGLIERRGAWYSYDEKQWQGRTGAIEYFMQDPEALAVLSHELIALVDEETVELESAPEPASIVEAGEVPPDEDIIVDEDDEASDEAEEDLDLED